ncbi:cation diffusion facilitator family transporter [Chloroflexota bacterium]
MGLPVTFASDDRGWRFHHELQDNLAALIKRGLVIEERGTYLLTPAGVAEAESAYQRARSQEDRFTAFVYSPSVASKLSVLASALLALLKLSTGFAFHSIALVADGLDSLIDVLSSSVVMLGARLGREAASAAFLIAVMGLASIYIFFEAFQRLSQGSTVEASTAAFVAAGVSGAVSHVMDVYQKMVGKRGGSLALVSQSRDSRGHAFQAVAVLVALGFARMGVYAIDAIVAFIAACVLLRSAIELAVELRVVMRSAPVGDAPNERCHEGTFDRHRWNFFKTWTLMTLKEASSRRDLVLRYDETFTPDDLPYATHRSPSAGFDYRKNVDGMLEELFEEGLITSHDTGLYLTAQGDGSLNRRLRRRRFGFSS